MRGRKSSGVRKKNLSGGLAPAQHREMGDVVSKRMSGEPTQTKNQNHILKPDLHSDQVLAGKKWEVSIEGEVNHGVV